jgi:hypothetical protein
MKVYSFETTARIKWLNYIFSQKAIQQSVNILLNGGKNIIKRKEKRPRTREKEEEKAIKGLLQQFPSYKIERNLLAHKQKGIFLFFFSV